MPCRFLKCAELSWRRFQQAVAFLLVDIYWQTILP
jgi:hypothetical protein